MKLGLLCLLLLPACSFPEPPYDPETYEYELTWYCISPEGCERTDEAARIDRATETAYDFHFTSTQDPSFDEHGQQVLQDSLPARCYWMYYLSFFGHDLERSRLCYDLDGFEMELAIPNEDPATHSQWVVAGRKL
jgi:hypothetical protein